MTDKMREAFETWARTQGLDVTDRSGLFYMNLHTFIAWNAWQAAQSVPVVAVEDVVLPIANAYESGIGHCNDNLCNPYKAGSAEAYAYDYGKEFGKSRATEHSVGDAIPQDWKGVDGAIAWHLIDRHGEGWGHIGDLMNAWLLANTPAHVPVAGEVVAYTYPEEIEGGESSAKAGRTGEIGAWHVSKQPVCPEEAIMLIVQPTHSVTAAELERLRKDAERWTALESAVEDGGLVIALENGKTGTIKLGKGNLRQGIDAAIAAEGEK